MSLSHRRALSQLSPVEAMELLLEKLRTTRSNAEFLAAVPSFGESRAVVDAVRGTRRGGVRIDGADAEEL